MSEPMTERELDEIRARLRSWPEASAIPAMQANMDRLRLVAEVERLVTQVNAMRPIVRVVAERWNELTRTGLYNLAEQARVVMAQREEGE